jgi:hypothetical protein
MSDTAVAAPSDHVKVRYLRVSPDDRKIYGAMAAVIKDGIAYIGWSVVHPKDICVKKLARKIAIDRATKRKCGHTIPIRAADEVLTFATKIHEKLGINTADIWVISGGEEYTPLNI